MQKIVCLCGDITEDTWADFIVELQQLLVLGILEKIGGVEAEKVEPYFLGQKVLFIFILAQYVSQLSEIFFQLCQLNNTVLSTIMNLKWYHL